ncbi:MAG: TetR/AcrR family transcriptional regulator [Deltaproteobacteria bacterium]|nr:TetR/AcrR family transcriptional regulator [Deltaproteobacteria bacterium]
MAARDTHEEILKVASALLQTRGFSAFSYAHIAEALDVKPAAIHYHFASKTDLGLALIARFRARYRRWIDEADEQGFSPIQKLDGYIRIAARFAEDGSGKVCPMGALESELGAIPPEMQRAVSEMAEEVYAWLARVLDEGKRSGAWTFDGDAEDMATFIASALQGGLQVGRALGKGRFDAVIRQIKKTLGEKATQH